MTSRIQAPATVEARTGISGGRIRLNDLEQVAWASPLRMTLLAVTFAGWAVAATRALRPGLATLAAGQLVGLGATIVAIEAKLGPQDSYGDHQAAFGVGLLVTGIGSAVGLAVLARSARS